MSWTEIDDDQLQVCYNRLTTKQKELAVLLEPIQVIINNTVKIQSRTHTSYNDKREQITTIVLPKDRWGKDMTDEYRLIEKDRCISETNELLGVEDEK